MTTKTKPNRFRFTPTRLEEAPRQAGVWHDTEQDGLIARRQSADGELVYYARYRTPGASGSGRLRLGRTDELPLAKARRMALDAVFEAKRGTDPSKARKAARRTAESEMAKAVTLGAFLDEYLEVQAAEEVQSTPERVTAIRQHLKAFLKSQLQDLTRRELVTALDQVKKDYPAAATKLRASVHHVFEIAFDRGVVDANPLAGRRERRGSSKARNVAKAEQEKGALSLGALARIWIAGDDPQVNSNFAAYVRTMIATGARRAELAAAKIDHLRSATESFPARLTLQPNTTKNGKAHTLFLPPLVMRAIDRVRRYPDEALLFPGRRRGGKSAMMTGWSKNLPPLIEAARKLGVQDPVHFHGFRRSFRTGLSRLGVSQVVGELMLNHTQDKLTTAYDKHDFAAERAEAAERWCKALEAAIANVEKGRTTDLSTNVIDVRRARASAAKRPRALRRVSNLDPKEGLPGA